MSNVLLIEMEFNNQTWYMSTEAYNGKAYYAPFIVKNPSLEFGQIKGGYIGTRVGNISIANEPNDRFSPFSVFSGGYARLLSDPTQKIPVKVYWEQNDIEESLFDGTMYMRSFNTDQITFLLENDFADKDLLEEAVDFDATLQSLASVSISAAGTTATVIAPDHGLDSGDLITVTNSSTANFNVSDSSITKVDDNTFTYTISSTTATETSGYTLEHFTKKAAPFSFGKISLKKGLIKTAELNGAEYQNPQLKTDDSSNPLLLFDDGVLVGTTSSSSTDSTKTGSAATKLGDEVTITTSSAHGAIVGNVVKVTGLSHNDYNGVFVVIDVPSTTQFVYFNNSPQTLSTGSSSVTIFGNYFGGERLPSATTIKSRQINPSATGTFDASSNPGTGGTRLIGTPLVSGISSNGQTIADFFVYVGTKLFPEGGQSFDFTRAPNASSKNLELWETSQKKVIDFAGKVAEGCNHLFRIKNKQITVVDRANIPDEFTTIENKDIVKAAYRVAFPNKAFQSNWQINFANTAVSPARLEQYDISAVISNSESGKVASVPNVTDNIDDQKVFLEATRQVMNKSIIDISIGGIRTDLEIGDRIKFAREEDSISVDMVIRTTKFNIDGLETSYSGEGTITVIENDSVY